MKCVQKKKINKMTLNEVEKCLKYFKDRGETNSKVYFHVKKRFEILTNKNGV